MLGTGRWLWPTAWAWDVHSHGASSPGSWMYSPSFHFITKWICIILMQNLFSSLLSHWSIWPPKKYACLYSREKFLFQPKEISATYWITKNCLPRNKKKNECSYLCLCFVPSFPVPLTYLLFHESPSFWDKIKTTHFRGRRVLTPSLCLCLLNRTADNKRTHLSGLACGYSGDDNLYKARSK